MLDRFDRLVDFAAHSTFAWAIVLLMFQAVGFASGPGLYAAGVIALVVVWIGRALRAPLAPRRRRRRRELPAR
jgi:hypothetical protein